MSEILGYKLTDIDSNALVPVPEEFDGHDYDKAHLPLEFTMPNFEEAAYEAGLGDYSGMVSKYMNKGAKLTANAQAIPTPVMEAMNVPLDIWAKAKHGTNIMCDWSDRFEEAEDLNWWLTYKLGITQWKWGYKTTWNAKAFAMQSIPRFTLPIFDEIRFDTSTHFNERGYGREHRDVYLDGPLAYMCYLDGKHVMTVSFAITHDRKLLITQIQVRGKGNRWLYKFDRKAEVVKAFTEAFPDFEIYFPTGESMASYLRSHKEEALKHHRHWMSQYRGRTEEYNIRSYEEHKAACEKVTASIGEFDEVTRDRVIEFYGAGREAEVSCNKLQFSKAA